MATFDWPAFLNDYQIPHQFGGKNTRADWIGVSCPLCAMEGNPDPSTHLGIDPESGAWNCWRNPSHSGRKPDRLIQAWLRCNRQFVDSVTKRYSDKKPERAERVLTSATEQTGSSEKALLTLPASVKSLKTFPENSVFHKYLIERGFDEPLLRRLIDEYDLHGATTGRWSYRLIVPIYMYGQLVSWVGRSVAGKEPRYLNATTAEASGVRAVRDCLLNFDSCQETGGDTLYLCEGPMDALKVDFYGKKFQVRATCFFGLTPTDQQHYTLHELRAKFIKTKILLDRKAYTTSIRIRQALADIVDGVEFIPSGYDDPGSLPKDEVRALTGL